MGNISAPDYPQKIIMKAWHTIFTTVTALLLIFVLVGNILYDSFDNLIFLKIVDSYLKIVLTSWPASILLLGLFLLSRHRGAIDHFIKNRMTGVGFDGVKGDLITGSASDTEVKIKNITDSNVESEEKNISENIRIEEGYPKRAPGTLRLDVYNRYKETLQVEDRMQAALISNFPGLYKPHAKLSLPSGKSIVLDGLFTTLSGSLRAVEIKYIGDSKQAPTLTYSLRHLIEKLEDFGIKKMDVIIVAKNLKLEEAVQINTSIKLKAKKYFFSMEGDELIEVPLPPRRQRLIM